jgi:hypothetical protein
MKQKSKIKKVEFYKNVMSSAEEKSDHICVQHFQNFSRQVPKLSITKNEQMNTLLNLHWGLVVRTTQKVFHCSIKLRYHNK